MIRFILLLILSSFLSVPANAQSRVRLRLFHKQSVTSLLCAQDGRALAPAGSAQYPNLLTGYAARSPCQVAGVDYPVGIPAGTSLQNPASVFTTSSSPWKLSGTGNKTLRCDSGSNTTLDGFDFTGYIVSIVSCSNVTVKNSRLVMNATNCGILVNVGAGSSNVNLLYNEIDGGGVSGCSYLQVSETVQMAGTGMKRVQYNWIKNVPQHFVSFTGSTGGTIDYRYNLEENCGFFQGAHCNGFQIVSGSYSGALIAFNTYISSQPSIALSTGQSVPSATFTAGSPTFTATANMAPGTLTQTSIQAGMTVVSDCLPPNSVVTASNNAGAPTITVNKNAITTGTCAFDVPNAYPSGITGPLRYFATINGTLINGMIMGNTSIATTPVITVSYGLYCGADGTSSNSGASIGFNYFDSRGSFGPFWTGSGFCTGVAVSPAPNIDMTTGAVIPNSYP